jgi:hypothetical protein
MAEEPEAETTEAEQIKQADRPSVSEGRTRDSDSPEEEVASFEEEETAEEGPGEEEPGEEEPGEDEPPRFY